MADGTRDLPPQVFAGGNGHASRREVFSLKLRPFSRKVLFSETFRKFRKVSEIDSFIM